MTRARSGHERMGGYRMAGYRMAGYRGSAVRRRVIPAGLAAVLVLVVAGAGCSRPDDVSLRPGSCLTAEAKVIDRREANPPTVHCDKPHRYETYAVGDLDADAFEDGTWPGQDAVDAAARQYCYDTFEPNVGFGAQQMGDDIRVVYITPTAQSWTNQRDREVECLLMFTEDRSGRLAVADDEPTPA
ncbi:MAG: hypothetical protein GX868_13920 [Actinobacteria bacterium]|nr:hypothetical protein [Actinomycetota bacterium]